ERQRRLNLRHHEHLRHGHRHRQFQRRNPADGWRCRGVSRFDFRRRGVGATMSLLGALNSAVSALNAQSQNIAMIADNLANQNTVGYKTTSASFESLITGATSSSSY